MLRENEDTICVADLEEGIEAIEAATEQLVALEDNINTLISSVDKFRLDSTDPGAHYLAGTSKAVANVHNQSLFSCHSPRDRGPSPHPRPHRLLLPRLHRLGQKLLPGQLWPELRPRGIRLQRQLRVLVWQVDIKLAIKPSNQHVFSNCFLLFLTRDLSNIFSTPA